MRLVFHGGECCGIKTIHSLGYNPSEKLDAVDKETACSADQFGQEVSSRQDFFTQEAPSETRKERLDRLIKFCIEQRPQGIIEITLATNSYVIYDQIKQWGPLLRKRGFRCVTKAKNSNSGNVVHVFHKVYGDQ